MQPESSVLSKTTSTLIQVAAVIAAITVIAGTYSFYIGNLWYPKVKVLEYAPEIGVASVQVNNKIINLEGDEPFLIKGDWGVKLGRKNVGSRQEYDGLYLIKKGMIFQKLS